MMPKLNTEGKQALLEQSLKLRCFEFFKKILFVEKCFVNLASFHSVYYLGLDINQDNVSVWFADCSGNKLKTVTMTFERARRLFYFLYPALIVKNYAEHNQKKFDELLENSDCGVVMQNRHLDYFPGLIERIWPRIIGIKIDARQLYRLNNLPVKKFDSLEICDIVRPEQLRNALRFSTRNLILHVGYYYSAAQVYLDSAQDFVPGKIWHCKIVLDRWFYGTSVPSFMPHLIKMLQSTPTSLAIINHNRIFESGVPESLLRNLTQYAQWSTNVADALGEAGIISTIKLYLGCSYYRGYATGNWVDHLNERPVLNNFQINIVRRKGSNISLKLERKIGNVGIELDAIFK